MSAAWRLAISNLSRRRVRTGLLIACITLCSALVAAISCAIASINAGLQQRLEATIGAADLRVLHPGKSPFDAQVVRAIESWPQTKLAAGFLVESISLQKTNADGTIDARVLAYGVMPDAEAALRNPVMRTGRWLTQHTGEPRSNQIVLDTRAAEAMNATLGDRVALVQFGANLDLTVVGIVEPPPLSAFINTQPAVFVDLAVLGEAVGRVGQVTEVQVVIEQSAGDDGVALAESLQGELRKVDARVVVQTTAKATKEFQHNRKLSQVGLVVSSVFAFLGAAFIIATAMTTGLAERMRELAILRAVGCTRSQLAKVQLWTGVVVGVLGGVLGSIVGATIAWILVLVFPEQLPGGFAASAVGLACSVLGAVLAGVIGAGWSAWRVSRISPLAGLASRGKRTPSWVMPVMMIAGLSLIGVHLLVTNLQETLGQRFFWFYVPIAIPAMLSGYFLLGTPVTRAIGVILTPLLTRLLALPPRFLGPMLRQTPFRHGLTAASMMIGVSMMVSLWANGRSVLDNYLQQLQFPDAFVTGLSLHADTADRIRQLDGVKHAVAITLQNVDTDAFGIKGLTSYRTTFVAFEPEPFFAMTRLKWIQGDVQSALPKLQQGSAVLVAQEFLVTRGKGVGEKIVLKTDQGAHEFEIVGVVTSPGLDIASKFFDIGENYVDQAINSVFGSRADLLKHFGNDAINLVQMKFDEGVDAEAIMARARNLRGSGILAGSTAIELRKGIEEILTNSLKIFSFVAVGAMVIASFGVANVIIAGVQSRTYQFGVLRAVGAQAGSIARLVIAEAIIIALAAGLLGTMLGWQAAFGGQKVSETSIGIQLPVVPPLWPTLAAITAAVIVTVLAATPTAWGLLRRRPLGLLSSVKG